MINTPRNLKCCLFLSFLSIFQPTHVWGQDHKQPSDSVVDSGVLVQWASVYSELIQQVRSLFQSLDFLDPDSALQGFMSNGIQHTFLFAEYYNLHSFETSGVTFERNGIYAGFLFEY